MKKFANAFLLGLAFSGAASAQAPASVEQTLVGRWEWINPEKKCREVLEVRPKGLVVLYSGTGRFDGTYEISARPSPRGLYRLVMKTPKSAEKRKDCTGSEEELPEVEAGYIWIDGTKEMFMFCEEDNFTYCTPPVHRAR
jgi:hypothetical protein